MKNFEELSFEEMQSVEGGYWRLIYDAIRSGIIYDGLKAGVGYLLENSTEMPEWQRHKMAGL